jgi:DHA1 family multidrug resistance protein-like MFS transporter
VTPEYVVAARTAEEKPVRLLPQFRDQLALVCIADFLVWLGSGAIYPYLPVFLREDTGASLGTIGLIASAYFVAMLVFSVPAGRLSDRIGRKPMIVGGTFLYAISTLLFLTTKEPWLFVLFRSVEGIGAAAVVPAAQALVAEISSDEHRSRAYGWLTTAQYAGLIIGPVAAWPMYALGGGQGAFAFYAIFLFGAVITAAAAAALAVFLREPAKAERRSGDGERRPGLRTLVSRPIAAIILVVATAEFAMGGFEVVWSIYLRDLGASLTVVGLTWVLFSAPLLLSFLGGRLADRYSRFALMTAGFAVQGACWLLVPVFHDPAVFLLLLPLDGLAFAFAFPAKQAFLVQVSPRRWLGSIQGIEQAAMQLAAVVGTVTAPLLYASVGGWFFALAGGVALTGLLVAAPVLRRTWSALQEEGGAR